MKKIWWISLAFLLLSDIGMFIFILNRPVVTKEKIVYSSDKLEQLVRKNNDSLIKVYNNKFDSIQKSIPKLETEVKIIYKNSEREKNTIAITRNIDSLRKSAIEYVKSVK